MRQLLTPRMIQSMEILQLPLMALEERIEEELQSNPVLELRDPADNADAPPATESETTDSTHHTSEDERPLVVQDDPSQSEDFDRLNRLSEFLENEEFITNAPMRPRGRADDGDLDRKQEAMNNTAARGRTLVEHLLDQWAMIEGPANIHQAGAAIINYIDAEGYLRTPLQTIQEESPQPLALADLETALKLVQTLEPAGVGARTAQECLLLQLDALEEDEDMARGHDFELERALVRDHLKDLEQNRYPQISRKLGREITDIKAAVRMLSRLTPHPGKLIGRDEAPAITPDARIRLDEDTGRYEVDMLRQRSDDLYISGHYRRMLKDRALDRKTRQFLSENVRNARWLLDSIQQRNNTIARVIRVVVDAQREFFEKGPEFLKPLPMIQVADQLGIHVATVSRAVSEKWIQTPRGIYPLRRFFSGGTQSADGQEMSWDAIKEKLKVIIDNEDKAHPLNDDVIVEKLKEQGIDLARRTVAKYRKLLNIPTARQRVQY
jgi:RNA polymerase sigma-54 factor